MTRPVAVRAELMGAHKVRFDKGRFLRFSVRQLLVLMAVTGLLLAILAPRFQQAYSLRRDLGLIRQLFAAVAAGDATGAARAIGAGARPDAVDDRGHTPLYYALEANDAALARALLEAGADPNQATHEVPHLLPFCIDQGHVEMVRLLLDHGANVEGKGLAGVTVRRPLKAAIESNLARPIKLRIIRILLEHGADLSLGGTSRDAMDLAVAACDGDVGDLLREFGAAYTPREAVAFNRLDEVRRLVAANPVVLRERFRPLYATRERPDRGPTMLGTALRCGHREMATYLVDAGAPVDAVEYLGYSMLHQAVRGGDPELIRLLIARGADPYVRDEYEDAPLHDAVRLGNADVVAALLESGADPTALGLQDSPLVKAVQLAPNP